MSTYTRELYPAIEPYASSTIQVDEIHCLYYEECGNPQGKPVVFLHGGPGGGVNADYRRYFDPQAYRVILFDQRGCGRSTPHACLEANTTWHLVSDIEAIRERLGIDCWQVFGGSWGSTLALAYAQSHPQRVTELVLRGLFTLRRAELLWFYQHGASEIFPDAWEDYLAPIPESERDDMISAYYRRLTGEDLEVRRQCARAWSTWEGTTVSLLPSVKRQARFGEDDFALSFARIECHYFSHGGFFNRDDQLLHDLPKIQHIPAVLVQGRYDMCTPLRTAWEIHKAWPQADFRLIRDAGHAASEPGIVHELVAATDRFRF